MKRVLAGCMVILFTIAGFAYAEGQRKTAAEAKAMVEKAVAYYKANGREKALAAFNDPKGAFVDGEIFVFALNMDGTILAHGGQPALVGKGPNEIRDPDEKNFILDLVEAAKTKKTDTVNYKIGNPASLVVEKKSSFVEEVDGIILGSGYFTAYEWQVFPHPASR